MSIYVKFKDKRVSTPCYFCGTTKGVGYETNVKQINGTEKDVDACYSCVQKLILQNEVSMLSESEDSRYENMG